MGKDKFVQGSGRKKVPRPQPPHADRRLKRNRTRSDQERAAEQDQREEPDMSSAEFKARQDAGIPVLIILPCEICGRADGRHTEEECFK